MTTKTFYVNIYEYNGLVMAGTVCQTLEAAESYRPVCPPYKYHKMLTFEIDVPEDSEFKNYSKEDNPFNETFRNNFLNKPDETLL